MTSDRPRVPVDQRAWTQLALYARDISREMITSAIERTSRLPPESIAIAQELHHAMQHNGEATGPDGLSNAAMNTLVDVALCSTDSPSSDRLIEPCVHFAFISLIILVYLAEYEDQHCEVSIALNMATAIDDSDMSMLPLATSIFQFATSGRRDPLVESLYSLIWAATMMRIARCTLDAVDCNSCHASTTGHDWEMQFDFIIQELGATTIVSQVARIASWLRTRL